MLAGLAAASSAASLTASGATGCTFKGASWEFDGRTGTTYTVTVLRGVTCAQAAAVARPLTHRRSQGLRKRTGAARLALPLPFASRLARRARRLRAPRRARGVAAGRRQGAWRGKPPTKPKPRGA